METIEEYENVRILNDEPEFVAGEKDDVKAEFFILCEENDSVVPNKRVCDCKICGMSILNWVVRACVSQPKVLNFSAEASVIQTIKPYIDDSADYSVVLFADTPLLNRTHLSDLLSFVSKRRMNVCKLKRGYVFSNEYIKENDEIFSVDEYDFASNDFFIVQTIDDLSKAQEILNKKVLDYHKKNGVYFESEQNVCVDANTEIGYGSEIASGVALTNCAKLGQNVKLQKNVIISGSKVEDDAKVGLGAMVIDSIVKEEVVIGEGVIIKNSVIGNNARIEAGSRVFSSSVRAAAFLHEGVLVDNSRIGENTIIDKHSKILGVERKNIIEKNTEIGANCVVEDCVISQNSRIYDNMILKNRVEEE